jgi:hypothetical protein
MSYGYGGYVPGTPVAGGGLRDAQEIYSSVKI